MRGPFHFVFRRNTFSSPEPLGLICNRPVEPLVSRPRDQETTGSGDENEQNTTHFPLIFPGVTHTRNCLTDNDLTDRCSARWLQEGGIAASNVCLQALSALSLPFPCYFFPKQRAWAWSIQPKFQPVRPGKEDHLKRWTRKLFRLDRTDPLSFGPKFPESLVEWIAPLFTGYAEPVPEAFE